MSAQGTIPYKLLMPERARSSGTIRLEAQSTLHQQSLMMSSISAFWTQRSILLKPRQGPYFGAAPLKTESARRLRLSMEWSMQARRITRSTRAMPALTRSSGATPQGIALSPHPWGLMASSTSAPTIITFMHSTRYISRQEKIVKIHRERNIMSNHTERSRTCLKQYLGSLSKSKLISKVNGSFRSRSIEHR